MFPYIDKQAELLNILLDIYMEMQDTAKCHELIAEIDHINETYKEQGVCREVSSEIREKAGSREPAFCFGIRFYILRKMCDIL